MERRRNRSTTQIVVESIEHYYRAMTEEPGEASDLLERSGFVGCARGPSDLSVTYKADLARSIREKT
jgi:hypothetical protein